MSGQLSPPAPLADRHQLKDFRSGEASLDGWLALGFDPCPREPMTLVVTLSDIRATLSHAEDATR